MKDKTLLDETQIILTLQSNTSQSLRLMEKSYAKKVLSKLLIQTARMEFFFITQII